MGLLDCDVRRCYCARVVVALDGTTCQAFGKPRFNQWLASIEYNDNSLHSALRGGVSNRFTRVSPGSRYATVSVLSIFPMLNQGSITRELRGDTDQKKTNALEAAAAILINELGHKLLHLGHPYGNKPCIMNPAELLQFEAWTQQLNAAHFFGAIIFVCIFNVLEH